MAATSILLIDPEKHYLRSFLGSLDHRGISTSTWDPGSFLVPAERVDTIVASWVPGDAQGLLDLIALKHHMRARCLTIIANGLDLAHIEEAYGLGIDELIAAPATPQSLLVTLLRPAHRGSGGSPGFRVICCPTTAAEMCRIMSAARSTGSPGRGLFDRMAGRLRERTDHPLHGRDAGRCTGAPPQLDVYLLGRFRVRISGRDVDRWPNHKAKLMFAYLLHNHQRPANRETLMELFWPGAMPESSRNCLNVTMHVVRRILQEADPRFDYIRYNNEAYAIDGGVVIRLDTEEVSRCWADAQVRARSCHAREIIPVLERALSVYRGDFLEDELYDEWAGQEREHYRELCISIMDRLSCLLCEERQWESASDVCGRLLTMDPCQEEVHRRLMLCYSSLGHRSKALRQFKVCCDVLRKELAAEPSPATRAAFASIARGATPVRIKR